MKKYDVQLDVDAEEDLFEIYKYVALNDSVERADHLYRDLMSACYSLITLPLRGHIPPELQDIGVSEFREIRFKPYRIFYSIDHSTVTVHSVFDGRRDMQSLLQERLLR
jgi:toxin ParE1/3/4